MNENTEQKAVDVLAVMPDWSDWMVRVTRESFFATVGQLNVNPTPVGRYDRVLGFRSDWNLSYGCQIASTIGGTTFSEHAYFVTPDFYESNRTTLARVGGGQ